MLSSSVHRTKSMIANTLSSNKLGPLLITLLCLSGGGVVIYCVYYMTEHYETLHFPWISEQEETLPQQPSTTSDTQPIPPKTANGTAEHTPPADEEPVVVENPKPAAQATAALSPSVSKEKAAPAPPTIGETAPSSPAIEEVNPEEEATPAPSAEPTSQSSPSAEAKKIYVISAVICFAVLLLLAVVGGFVLCSRPFFVGLRSKENDGKGKTAGLKRRKQQ